MDSLGYSSYFGARDTQTQVCIHYMDGLGYFRTVPVTLVHGILRNRGAYNLWMVLNIPGLSQLFWCTGYLLRHRGAYNILLLCMDDLGYSRTVPVTLVHGILRHRGALTMCGLSWILQGCLSNFGTRDT